MKELYHVFTNYFLGSHSRRCSLLIYTAVPVQAGGKSDSEVKITALINKRDDNGKQILTVTLLHNKGWHTYA